MKLMWRNCQQNSMASTGRASVSKLPGVEPDEPLRNDQHTPHAFENNSIILDVVSDVSNPSDLVCFNEESARKLTRKHTWETGFRMTTAHCCIVYVSGMTIHHFPDHFLNDRLAH